ncbi:hypothetical protein [Kitasatospora sp. NPDC085464]|uniref:hypothetical protein n=1 Tax=Kitasatospora sp. NPDC085464 TaxID=3364063 RepID=UPI0037CBF1F0
MIRTPTTRAALAAATALLALAGPAAAAARATPPQAAPADAATVVAPTPVIGAPVRAGTPAADRVAAFLEAYRAAVLGQSDRTPRQVRGHYLSAHLNHRLDARAQQPEADPVFRAQDVPARWAAQEVGQEKGFASVRLTESWGDGSGRDVWYAVRLTDLRILDLGDEPAL